VKAVRVVEAHRQERDEGYREPIHGGVSSP
jgi:hypothetical protein